MARKIKVDNSLLKRIKLKKEREKRSYRNRPIRRRVLIVCEGEKTEPNYFNAFKMLLSKGTVSLDIIGEGKNTIDVVRKTIELRNAALKTTVPYDDSWAVFDKDSFPNDRFNDAVFLARRENIKCAYSIEAFELWYLLHFELYQNSMSREVYGKLLSNHLGIPYEKNSRAIFGLLQSLGDEELATQRARRLQEFYNGHNPSQENPVTYVNELVSMLREQMVN